MVMKLPREQKLQMIGRIQSYFWEQKGEELGNLAAEDMIDFFMKEIGPYVYNIAIADARAALNQKMISLEEDLYSLEKQIRLSGRKGQNE